MTAHALTYPLGRPLAPSTTVRRSRPLPVGATPLVSVGERIASEQIIAEARTGQSLTTTFAGIGGRVVQVIPGQSVLIEGVVTLIHGILGSGGPAAGLLYTPGRGESLAVARIPHGSVVLYPARAPLMLLQRALASGAAGVIAASASALEIEAFARTDLTAALDGVAPSEVVPPLTVVLTEGVGEAEMDPAILHVLMQRVGDMVLLNGTTVPRENVRPEILISLPPESASVAMPMGSEIASGALVRVIAGQARGARGRVARALSHERRSRSGQWEPSVQVRLEDGSSLIVPTQHLDVIG
jgi:hypothetical protein